MDDLDLYFNFETKTFFHGNTHRPPVRETSFVLISVEELKC